MADIELGKMSVVEVCPHTKYGQTNKLLEKIHWKIDREIATQRLKTANR